MGLDQGDVIHQPGGRQETMAFCLGSNKAIVLFVLQNASSGQKKRLGVLFLNACSVSINNSSLFRGKERWWWGGGVKGHMNDEAAGQRSTKNLKPCKDTRLRAKISQTAAD